MEASGWLLLVVSWSAIGGLAGFCLWRVLRDGDGGNRDRDR
jgi:hypothetical protein